MAIDSEARSSRRNILLAALGGAGAAIATRLGAADRVRAADGGNAVLGQANTSSTETSFENTDAGETSLRAIQTTGTALWGEATNGTAIHGQATGTGFGLTATSDSGTGASITSGTGLAIGAGSNEMGVQASSNTTTPSTFAGPSNKTGVYGSAGDLGSPGDVGGVADNTDETGVYGFANLSGNSTGVWGDSWDGAGVLGTGSVGVWGTGGIGLYGHADSASSYALYTNGKIKFSGRAGRSSIGSGHSYKDVTIAGMTSGSAVIATLQTHKSGFYVAAVVSYTGKFRMYLNKSATSTMYFSYIVIG